MDRNLALEMVRVTEAAALNAALWMGKGDGNAADAAAVNAMRRTFDVIQFDGTVVIGEGERDEAPMLYIGEKVGSGGDPEVDIALDPLECTNSVAYGRPNAMSAVALSPKGCFLHAPDTYMEKIAVGRKAADAIDLNKSVEQNIHDVGDALGMHVEDMTVVILDRDRHQDLIKRVRAVGARIHLIPDGDLSAAIAAALPNTGIDMLIGIGGAPEGVLAAAALRCVGGAMKGRLVPRNQEEINRAKKMGITDLTHIFDLHELAQGDSVMFCATGVTEGDMLRGVRFFPGGARTHSLVMRAKSGTIRFIETQHFFERKPAY